MFGRYKPRAEEKRRAEEDIENLTTISGGPYRVGLANKIIFYFSLFMNAFLYDKEWAHREAEERRNSEKEHSIENQFPCSLSNVKINLE